MATICTAVEVKFKKKVNAQFNACI
jgi:hypothetical protein